MGKEWNMTENIKLTILYCGGISWPKIAIEFPNRTISSCKQHLPYLNIPRTRDAGRPMGSGIKLHPTYDLLDLQISELYQKGHNKHEIAEELKTPLGTVQGRLYGKQLHLNPITPEAVEV